MLNPKGKHKHPTVWDPNRTFWATDVAGNVPCEPTDAHALLSVATTTDAASTGTTIWRAGAHAEENCAAAEEAGLPSASTASATWLGSIREYAAALRFPLWLGHPVVAHVSERGAESSAQEDESGDRAMQRATIEPITALGSERRGVRRNEVFCDGETPLRRRGLGPAGRGGHSGAGSTYLRGLG